MRMQNFWDWEGRVSRGTYLFVGISAFALKFLLDRLIVTRMFHREWGLQSYWRPFGAITGVHRLTPDDRFLAGVMLFVALPFIWLGLSMTAKRLRDAGAPTWLAALFFLPLVNLVFFIALIAMPTVNGNNEERTWPWPGPQFMDQWFPRDKIYECAGKRRPIVHSRTDIRITRYYGGGEFWLGAFCGTAILLGAVRGFDVQLPRTEKSFRVPGNGCDPHPDPGTRADPGGGRRAHMHIDGRSFGIGARVAWRKSRICHPSCPLETPECDGDVFDCVSADSGIFRSGAFHAATTGDLRSEKCD